MTAHVNRSLRLRQTDWMYIKVYKKCGKQIYCSDYAYLCQCNCYCCRHCLCVIQSE